MVAIMIAVTVGVKGSLGPEQRNIDLKKEKIVAGDIEDAKSRQKVIDRKKERTVAVDIKLALQKSDSREKKNKECSINKSSKTYHLMHTSTKSNTSISTFLLNG